MKVLEASARSSACQGGGVRLDRCPTCRRRTTPQRGHPSLCLACTEAEIGVTVAELRERVTAALQKGRTRKWRVTS